MRFLIAGVVLATGFAHPVLADDPSIRGTYTKFEYRIPMRDGVKLMTAVYVPKDPSGTKKYPILIKRTPYGIGPYGVNRYPDRLGPSTHFSNAGYIFVDQDVRGRMRSEGEFAHGRPINPNKKTDADIDESTDAYDTIDWLLKNVPGHNGRVGLVGISYPGFYAACALIDAHPAVKAVSPQAPVTDLFDGDDCRHNGVLLLAHNFDFFGIFPRLKSDVYTRPGTTFLDYGTPDGYDFYLKLGSLANAAKYHERGAEPFWAEIMAHQEYDDFCKARDLRPHLKNIKPAVLVVGGWYDAEDLAGTLGTYHAIESQSPDRRQNVLVMGPWVHGGWFRGDGTELGPVKFHAKTAEYYRDQVEFPFFEQHLRGEKPVELAKAALVFETGTNRWRSFDTWPPKQSEPLKLAFAGGQSLAFPDQAPEKTGFEEYRADPAKPVPYVEKTTIKMDKEYMTADQRFAARRPDVLVYQTPVLTDDLAVAGPIEVELHVSTTGTDADFVVKVIDVYPDDHPDLDPNPTGVRLGGYQQLVRGEPFRGKYRKSRVKPEPFTPGEPAVIKFTLPDIVHSFRTGHRVMVQVQSSWFPFADLNPQTFCDIGNATAADFQPATHRVHHGPEKPSGITLRVVKP